jgi:diaminopimelate epimerase
MKELSFIKMDGIGNDFVIVDGRKEKISLSAEQIATLGDRRTGIGFDQFFIIERSQTAAAKMLIFNGDGSPAGACGNGTRCIAKILFDEGQKSPIKIEAPQGKTLTVFNGAQITVDMGEPQLSWQEIPLAEEWDTLNLPKLLPQYDEPIAVSMGNPHTVFFVDDIETVDLEDSGAAVENDKFFPEKTNVEFAQVVNDNKILMRVWERGAGVTQACGSGACATLVAAAQRGLIKNRKAAISMPGGELTIEWKQEDNRVYMTGPVHTAFKGVAYL